MCGRIKFFSAGDQGLETPLGMAETYSYHAADKVIYTDRNGTTHTYSYDSLDRLTADTVTTFGAGVDQTVGELGYAYTDAGNLYTATSYAPNGTVVNQDLYTYDGLGNVTREYQAFTGVANTSSTLYVATRTTRPLIG